MDNLKREYQIRCSHYELELLAREKKITCSICGKIWNYLEERGYSIKKEIYCSDINDYFD
jgi:hypothetical protein